MVDVPIVIIVLLSRQARWLVLKTPKKAGFLVGKGEVVAFPLVGDRQSLYVKHGFADVPVTLPSLNKSILNTTASDPELMRELCRNGCGDTVSMGFFVGTGAVSVMSAIPRLSWGHLGEGDCVFTHLQVCRMHWDAQYQLHQLRQFGLLQSDVKGCVSPTSLSVDQDTGASGNLRSMLTYVKAVTGVHSNSGAKLCLSRLLSARFQRVLQSASASDTVFSWNVTSRPPLAVSTAQRFMLGEYGLLRSVWEREVRLAASVDASLSDLLAVDVTRMDALDVHHQGLLCTAPTSTQPWLSDSPCDTQVCVSCADLIKSAVQTAKI
jgi:hypothetical protein